MEHGTKVKFAPSVCKRIGTHRVRHARGTVLSIIGTGSNGINPRAEVDFHGSYNAEDDGDRQIRWVPLANLVEDKS